MKAEQLGFDECPPTNGTKPVAGFSPPTATMWNAWLLAAHRMDRWAWQLRDGSGKAPLVLEVQSAAANSCCNSGTTAVK